MTLGYGATKYGMGQQINEDSKTLNDYLYNQETLWSVMLGRVLHETCYTKLKGPASFLRFFEELAELHNEQDRQMQWFSPITNFPVIQNYRKPVTSRTKLRYGEAELHVNVENWDDSTLHKDRQRQGSSPNIVHSLDAVHLALIVSSADFPMAVVHDSFGCTPGHMARLSVLIKEKFVELYQSNPLEVIVGQLGLEVKLPEKGNLNIREIMNSNFAFV